VIDGHRRPLEKVRVVLELDLPLLVAVRVEAFERLLRLEAFSGKLLLVYRGPIVCAEGAHVAVS